MNSSVVMAKPPRETAGKAWSELLPWLLLPYDSLTWIMGTSVSATSQTLPATALYSIIYLVLHRGRLSLGSAGRQVLLVVLAAYFFMIIVTAANIIDEFARANNVLDTYRLATALRQAISMLMGITTLAMFQSTIRNLGLARCMRYAALGSLPTIIAALMQIGRGEFRVQGLSSEPAQFADMLVFALIPAVFLGGFSRRLRVPLLLFGGFLLLLTFSSTGYMKALFAIAAYAVSRGRFVSGLIMAGGIIAIGGVFLVLNPDNYVVTVLGLLYKGIEDGSYMRIPTFVDRFYGLVGPISLAATGHGLFGFGFGGDTVYFPRLFTREIAEIILSVKADVPALTSMQGKLLMYGGIFGYSIFLCAWILAFRAAPKGHAARFMMPAIFAGSLFSMGPLFLPHIWLWLAIASVEADGRQPLMVRKRPHVPADPAPVPLEAG